MTTTERKKPGRKPTYTDDQLLDAIESGAMTTDAILAALHLRSKTTLLTRLRRLRDGGLVTIQEHRHPEPWRVYSNRRRG